MTRQTDGFSRTPISFRKPTTTRCRLAGDSTNSEYIGDIHDVNARLLTKSMKKIRANERIEKGFFLALL